MAAIATAASGNWSSTATWTGGTKPTASDTVTMNHSLTLDENASIAGLTGNYNVPLTLNEDCVLTSTGSVIFQQNYSETGTPIGLLTMGAGSGIELNPGTGVTVEVKLCGTNFGNWQGKLTANGTAAKPCFIRKATGAAGTAKLQTNSLVATYLNLTDLGTASVDGAILYNIVATSGITWDGGTVTGCGKVAVTLNGGGYPFHIQNVHFTGGLNYDLDIGGANHATDLRKLSGNSFGNLVKVINDRNFLLEGNVFGNTLLTDSVDSTHRTGSIANNLFWLATGENDMGWPCAAAIDGNYFVHATTGTNPHFTVPNAPGLTNNIFDAPQAGTSAGAGDDAGEVFIGPPNGCAITGNLVLPIETGNWAGQAAGRMIALNKTSGTGITAERNTYVGTGYLFTLAENDGWPIYPGAIASIQRNLLYNPQASGSYKVFQFGTSPTYSSVEDVVAAGDADYNAGYHLSAGSRGKGYEFPGTGTPGAHDLVDVDPQFVDATRNVRTWAQTNHGTDGSLAAARAVLQADPSLIEELKTWVRAGFVPQNQALNVTAAGGWIGAFDGPAPTEATAYTLTGPATASSAIGTASGNFTVTPNGEYTGTITPSDGLTGVDAGTFTPSSLTWGGTSEAQTFTYTPAAWGEQTIACTSSPALTDPAGVAYTGLVQTGRTQPFIRLDGSYAGDSNENYHTPDFGGYTFCRDGGPLAEYSRDISSDTVHPKSDELIGATLGAYVVDSGVMDCRWDATGFPLSVVTGSQPMVECTVTGGQDEGPADWADPGPYPIPDDAGVQEWPALLTPPTAGIDSDAHVIVFDRDNELVYEGYHSWYNESTSKWTFGNVAIWDMRHGGGGYRADTEDPRYCAQGTHRSVLTPIDSVAGLPLLPLAARYDEVARGEINHAIGVTIHNVKLGGGYVWPARGAAYSNWTRMTDEWGLCLPYGARLRLKQSWYDANVPVNSAYWSGQCRVFIEAFRKYGLVIVDGGTSGQLWTVADSRWDYLNDLLKLRDIPLSAFEVLDFETNPTVTVEPATAGPGVERTITVTYEYKTGEHPRPIPVTLYTTALQNLGTAATSLTPETPSVTFTVTPTEAGTARYLLGTSSAGSAIVFPTDFVNGGLTVETIGALTAGTLTASSVTQTTASVDSTSASGGVSPYTYQLQVESPGEPGTWLNLGSSVQSAGDPPPWAVTGLVAGTSYTVRCQVTDSDTPASVVESDPITITTTTVSAGVVNGSPAFQSRAINFCPAIRG